MTNLLGLGLATPERTYTTEAMRAALTGLWELTGEDAARLARLAEGSGVVSRAVAMAPEEAIGLGTAARMEAFEALAPPLAEIAARRALGDAAVDPAAVTDLIVVSCTGFSAPGLDVALRRRLGLSSRVRRTVIGFMGCFGAIVGLRAARNIGASHPDAVALVVCLELCSLHLRRERAVENQVASTLFADGAAAAVIAGDRAVRASRGVLGEGQSLLVDGPDELMSWRVTDHGFAMRLSPRVPAVLRATLREEPASATTPIVHPGGPRILDAVADALGPAAHPALERSRAVLRDHGNMSSATVLFVLDRVLRRGLPLPGRLLAFGPGLSLEGIDLAPPDTIR